MTSPLQSEPEDPASRGDCRQLCAAAIHEAVMKSAVKPIVFIRDDLYIVDASQSFADFVFVLRPDLFGKPVTDLLKGDMAACLGREPAESASALAPCHMTAVVKGSEMAPVHVVALPLQINEDRYWFLQVTNLADTYQVERSKSEFVANVSHELRTPLASIAGALGLISAGATGAVCADTAEMVCLALNNTNRLIRLINDLLDVERMGTGKLHFAMGAHSFRKILYRATRELEPFALGRRITFNMEDHGGDDSIWVDVDRLLQVLTNVLSNAVKFSNEGGIVRVTLKPDDVYHRVDIADHGVGIPENFRASVFDKFTQADDLPNRRASGTGLGLAISREIVDQLDGRIWFAANPGGGTIFSIEIPASVPCGGIISR